MATQTAATQEAGKMHNRAQQAGLGLASCTSWRLARLAPVTQAPPPPQPHPQPYPHLTASWAMLAAARVWPMPWTIRTRRLTGVAAAAS